MTKKIVFFIGCLLFFSAGIVFAQTYQTIQTALTDVGHPVGGTGNRPQIADTIISHLTRGSDGFFNKISPNPFHYPGSSYIVSERGPNPPGNEDSTDSGYIFCTSLTVDVFNISGMALSRSLGNVNNMIAFWKSSQGQHQGYHFNDYTSAFHSGSKSQEQASLSQVKPGDAIFYANTWGCGAPYCHTGIVYAVNVNASGDGYIETREANAWTRSTKIAFSSWKEIGYITSFGGTQ